MSRDDELERIAREVVDCGFRLHSELGRGLLENVYELLLFQAIRQRGLACRRQVPVPIRYKGVVVDKAFKIDLLVEERLVVELKSTEQHAPVHAKQLTTYLRLTDLPLGILMNFGLATFKAGIKRIANDYYSGWTRH
jgi:GxxExxY protein